MKYGKLPARHGAIKLHFGTYFDAKQFPTPPMVFGKTSLIPDENNWGVLANDDWGCCVWSGAAHEHMLWNAEAGGSFPTFKDENVLADYSAVTGFDPKNPDTDRGSDMQQSAAYRQKTGIIDANGKRHKIDAYVSLQPGNIDQLVLATYLFSAVGVGIMIPESADTQFDKLEPWDIMPQSKMIGGHYIPCVGRNQHGNLLVVTWGRLQAVTPRFFARYMDEGVCYLSYEYLRDGKSRRGFDLATLESDLKKVSGRA